jgi:hypothetical protein
MASVALAPPDERTCLRCKEIRRMNINGVPIGRPFRTPDGPLEPLPLFRQQIEKS